MIDQFNQKNSAFPLENIIKAAKHIQHYSSANTNISPYEQIFQQSDDMESSRIRISNLRKEKVSIATIRQKLKEIGISEQKRQRSGFDKVLELLKEQRHNFTKIKEQKRRSLQELWKNFGTLMVLDKQKIQTDFVSLPNDQTKQKLYNQLICKNEYNLTSSKEFVKKIQQKSSRYNQKCQEALIKFRRSQVLVQKENKVDQILEETFKENPSNENKTIERRYKSLQLQKLANKSCINQIRTKPMPFRVIANRNSQEYQNDEIKAKVEQTFKSIKKNEARGKNILNSIVFDPDHVFSFGKRKNYFKNIQKQQQLQKIDKKQRDTKVLLKVGGIRLSLQENRYFRTIQT